MALRDVTPLVIDGMHEQDVNIITFNSEVSMNIFSLGLASESFALLCQCIKTSTKVCWRKTSFFFETKVLNTYLPFSITYFIRDSRCY